jgi:2-hydroxy-6-oxonona-2,4-dienedioate hydrolase
MKNYKVLILHIAMPAQSQKRGRFWYLLPIFLQVIGGLIAYFVLRNSNSTIARNALYVGIILSAVTTAVAFYLYLSFHNDIMAAQERVNRGSLIINTVYGPVEYAEAGDQHGNHHPVLLVIHGAGGGYNQDIILSRVLLPNDSHVIAPSRFGFLRTPVPENDASPAAQADAYAALLDKLHITKVVIVGFSAGDPSTLEFALRHPDKTLAVVLISAVVHREPPMDLMDKIIHYVIFKSDYIYRFS